MTDGVAPLTLSLAVAVAGLHLCPLHIVLTGTVHYSDEEA